MAETNRCPICQTEMPASVMECPVCGACLDRVQQPGQPARRAVRQQELAESPVFESELGEDDLYVPRLLRLPWWGIAIPIVVGGVVILGLALLAGVAASQWLGPRSQDLTAGSGGSTMVATFASGGSQGVTTALPTLFLPTLTPTDTPTAAPSPTETPGPCEQTVGPGDTLITLATRCGHRDLAVIDLILQMNGLRSAESLQLGQVLEIPWPTATPGPEPAESDPDSDSDTGAGSTTLTSLSGDSGTATPISDVIPTATLPPGVMWYTVQPDDNIIRVAVLFDANVEILSQLNPEVTFSQCDFGMDYGGATCIVQLYQGQQLRVPIPLPTATLSPTPSGSETPTATPTPTYNAPVLLSPGDRFLFGPAAIVTLRWVSTGTLAAGDVYRVKVTDTTVNMTYTATTTETVFIVPGEWQPRDGTRHLLTWEVAVGPADGQGDLASVTFSTPSRLFFWDSP